LFCDNVLEWKRQRQKLSFGCGKNSSSRKEVRQDPIKQNII